MWNLIDNLFASKNSSNKPAVNKSKPVDRGGIQNLEDKMNDRTFSQPHADITAPTRAVNNQSPAKSDWVDDDLGVNHEPPKKLTILNKLLLGAAGLFFIVLAIAVFLWSRDANLIEAEKIVFNVQGPTEIVAGEELELEVQIQNLNKTPITNVVIKSLYNKGAVTATGEKTDRYDVGFVGFNERKNIVVPIVFNGRVKEEVSLDFELEYSIPDSSTRYTIQYEENFLIESSPISLRANFPKSLTVGETQPFAISLGSTKKLDFDNYKLAIELPPDSQITDTSITGEQVNERVIEFDNLSFGPNDPWEVTGNIKIKRDNPGKARIGVSLESGDVRLADDEIDINLTLPPLLIVPRGDVSPVLGQEASLRYQITNTTDSSLDDVSIIISLPSNVRGQAGSLGIYNSSTNQFQFNPSTNPVLKSLGVGGSINIEVTVLPITGTSFKVDFNSTGLILRTGASRRELSVINFDYDIESPLQLDAFARYRQSNVINRGPLPPVVGQETTYTLTLATRITKDKVNPQELRATLPNNVEILGSLPGNMSVDGQVLRWVDPGMIETKTFQVSLVPDQSQVGRSAMLLGDIRLEYVDDRQTKYEYISPITTNLSRDSIDRQEEAIVKE